MTPRLGPGPVESDPAGGEVDGRERPRAEALGREVGGLREELAQGQHGHGSERRRGQTPRRSSRMSARRRGRYIPRTARLRRRGRRRARASRRAPRRRRRRASRGTTRAPRRAACRRRARAARVTRRPRAARAAPGCVAGQRPRVGASAPVEAQTWLSARSSSDYVSLARLREPSPQSCSDEKQRTAHGCQQGSVESGEGNAPIRLAGRLRRRCGLACLRLADGLPGMFVGADRTAGGRTLARSRPVCSARRVVRCPPGRGRSVEASPHTPCPQ